MDAAVARLKAPPWLPKTGGGERGCPFTVHDPNAVPLPRMPLKGWIDLDGAKIAGSYIVERVRARFGRELNEVAPHTPKLG